MTSTSVRHLNFFDQKPEGSKEFFALNYLWILVIVGLSAGVAGGFAYWQKSRIAALEEHVAKVTAENTQLRAEQNKNQQATLSSGARKDVLGDPVLWSEILKKMTKKVPDSIKLSHLSGSIGTKRIVVLKGSSPFVLPIFRLKENFMDIKECERPSLVSIEQARSTGGEEQISFQLECTLL